MPYRVEVASRAAKEIRKLARPHQVAVVGKIEELAEDPRPPGSKKLAGHELHRVRSCDYRILYTIEDDVLRVLVVRVGHRRDVYRRLK